MYVQYLQTPEGGAGVLGAGGIGSCEPPGVDAKNQAVVLCESSVCS